MGPLLLAVALPAALLHPSRAPRAPPVVAAEGFGYTDLVAALADGRLAAGAILPDASLRATLHDGAVERVQLLPQQVPALMDRLADAGVDVALTPPSPGAALLRDALANLPFLLFLAYAAAMLGGARSLTAMGGAARRPPDEEVLALAVETTFADVAGLATAKEELQEVVAFLRDPARFERSGARAPRGVLLEGPPGTGKTLLARAVAGEAGVAFLPATASSFVEMYVGVGAARVRSLFEQARRLAPCIVWIDEIDAVARQRSPSPYAGGGGGDEREATLNELLSAMDGFDGGAGVIVLAATNRADVLDAAILRPGRFDRRVPVPLPDARERGEILAVHAAGKRLDAATVDLDALALRTPGLSGAELANLLNEAAVRAARRNETAIVGSDVDAALDRLVVGLPRASPLTAASRARVAAHEAGHALVGCLLAADFDALERVTIAPRASGVGGFTAFRPTEERSVDGLLTRPYLTAQLSVLLAGQAAEGLLLDSVSVGASGDLERARSLATQMVTEWGMGDRRVYGSRSERSGAAVDAQVEALIEDAYGVTLGLLNAHAGALARIAALLDEEETVSGEAVRALL